VKSTAPLYSQNAEFPQKRHRAIFAELPPQLIPKQVLRATVQSVTRTVPEQSTPPVFSTISQSVSVRADTPQEIPPPEYELVLFVLTRQFLNVRLEEFSA
jgi:hypothetical protein